MKDGDLRLDGNAAGGLLNEIFPFEMTTAETTCTGCSATRPVGELMLYQHGMGAILRCPNCDGALIRMTHIRGYYLLDLSGTSCLRIAANFH
jgi:NAD-dependent SIR2 family protein deacetylase